jgi:hypothetical protein
VEIAMAAHIKRERLRSCVGFVAEARVTLELWHDVQHSRPCDPH